MKFSRLRTALLTCILGIVSVSFFRFEYEKWNEPYVNLPQVVSELPIVVKVCPELKSVEEQENTRGDYTGGANSWCYPYSGRQGEGGSGCGRKSESKSLSQHSKPVNYGKGTSTGTKPIKNH